MAKSDIKVATLIPLAENTRYLESMCSLEAILQYTKKQGYELYNPLKRFGSAVHINRNMLIGDLLQSRVPFTHVFFWDDDMVAPEDTLVRLIEHNVDVVGGLCSTRHRQSTDKTVIPTTRMWDEEVKRWEELYYWPNGLMELNGGGVGTAVMLISLHALQQVAEVYFQCLYEKEVWGMPEERALEISAERLKSFDLYPNAMWFRWLAPLTGNGENGEDISFCWVAQRYAGLKVHVDTTIKPGHLGVHAFTVDDFIQSRDRAIEQASKEGRLRIRHKGHLNPIDNAPPTDDNHDLAELIETASQERQLVETT